MGSLLLSQTTPAASASYLDNFTGTDGSALSTALWQAPIVSTGATATIQANAARMQLGTAGAYGDFIVQQSALTLTNPDVTVTVDATPGDTTEAYFSVWLRTIGTQTGYRVLLDSFGTAKLQKVASNTATLLGTSATVAGFAAGVVIHTELAVTGSTISATVWTGTNPRPATPTVTVTDTTYTAAGGHILNMAGGSAGAVKSWAVDNWTLTTATSSSRAAAATATSGSGLTSAAGVTAAAGSAAVSGSTVTGAASLAATAATTATSGSQLGGPASAAAAAAAAATSGSQTSAAATPVTAAAATATSGSQLAGSAGSPPQQWDAENGTAGTALTSATVPYSQGAINGTGCFQQFSSDHVAQRNLAYYFHAESAQQCTGRVALANPSLTYSVRFSFWATATGTRQILSVRNATANALRFRYDGTNLSWTTGVGGTPQLVVQDRFVPS